MFISTALSPILTVINNNPVVSSFKVAQHFEKRHDNVLRDIKALIDEAPECALNFEGSSVLIPMPKGGYRETPAYDMNEDGFTLLAMGFTGKKATQWKIAYMRAFKAMRAELQKTSRPSLPSLTPSTAGDRAALCALVKTWAMVSKMRFSHCWKQLNGHFNLERISDLPKEWIPEALSFVQGRIDSLPKALPEPEATPVPAPVRHPEVEEYKRRMDALLAAAKAINPDNIVMRAQLEAGAKRFARRDLWPVQQALFDAIGASAAAVESFRRLIDAAQSVAEG